MVAQRELSHVMLDLKTWGLRPGCALRSIGAVMFDPFSDRIGDEFYMNVRDENFRLHRDGDTVAWWEQQSAEAQVAFTDPPPMRLDYALSAFQSWWILNGAMYVWSKPQKYDLPIYEAACHATNRVEPWNRKNVRDVYTLMWTAGVDDKCIPFDGTPHHALHDAKHQARLVQRAIEVMRLNYWTGPNDRVAA